MTSRLTQVDLLRLEVHARAGDGGNGDQRLIEAVRCARRGDSGSAEGQLEMMRLGSERVCALVTDETITTIPPGVVAALSSAINPDWDRRDNPLIWLLRQIAPRDEALAHMDRIARENGFVQAGSDERIGPGIGGAP